MNSPSSIKVRFYSDSLGMPRKNEVLGEERYVMRLLNWLKLRYGSRKIELLERARPNYTIDQLYQWYKEDTGYYGERGHVLILHEGVCDCAPRPLPPRLRGLIGELPESTRSKIVKCIHKNRRRIQRFLRFHVTSPKVFQINYKSFLSMASENNTRVYVITIAPTNEKTENHSPGFKSSIVAYNTIIRAVVEEQGKNNIHLIDAYELLKKGDYASDDCVLEDGHHLTAAAHHIIFNAICDIEAKYDLGPHD